MIALLLQRSPHLAGVAQANHAMASVMAIKSEVFGSCVEEIEVSVEVEYEGRWLCCEQKYLRFTWEAKAAQSRQCGWVKVPGCS